MFSRAFPQSLRTAETLLTRTISRPRQTPPVKLSPLTRGKWRQQSIRPISTAAAAKKLFKQHPLSVTLASSIILAGIAGVFYAGYLYQSHVVGDFIAYPEEVANKLRRAVYYHNVDLQPQNALKYYRQALELSEQIGMDPFSDEILGVKLQVAALMEITNNPLMAIEVLSLIHADCLRWLEKVGDKPGNEGQRTRVLEKCVRMSVRIGELYSSDAIDDMEAAEEHLVWAVTVLLRESERREMEGVKEGEGPWLNHEEIGHALIVLGNNYIAKRKHSLAVPLLLRAFNILPKSDCRSVVIMSNIAVCLAQKPRLPSPVKSKLMYLASARRWSKKALAVAESIPPGKDREDCGEACAATMMNLGEIARIVRMTRASEEGGGWDIKSGGRGGNGLHGGGGGGGVPSEMELGGELDEGYRDGTDDGGDDRDWGSVEEEKMWYEKALELSRKISFKEGAEMAERELEELKNPVDDPDAFNSLPVQWKRGPEGRGAPRR